MAKAPASGQVKTRLCPPLSPGKAAGFYRCFLEDETAQVREVPEGLCASGLDAAIVIEVVELTPWYDAGTRADVARRMSELQAEGNQRPVHTQRLLLSMGRTFASGGRV